MMAYRFQNGLKFKSIIGFWEYISPEERIITDVLRQIILETMPWCREKLSYNVPFYYGKKRICFIWPSSVPWGGFKTGVMFGLCQGPRLRDTKNFLEKGSNKQVYYHIYQSAEEIDDAAVKAILREAIVADRS